MSILFEEAWVIVLLKRSGPALAKVLGDRFYHSEGEAVVAWECMGEDKNSWEVRRVLITFEPAPNRSRDVCSVG